MRSRVKHRKKLYKERLHTGSNRPSNKWFIREMPLDTHMFLYHPLFYIPKLGRVFFTWKF